MSTSLARICLQVDENNPLSSSTSGKDFHVWESRFSGVPFRDARSEHHSQVSRS